MMMSEIEPTTTGEGLPAPGGGEIIPGVPRLPTAGADDVDTTSVGELDRLIEALQVEAKSEATRRAYAADWRRYRAWAEGLDLNVDDLGAEQVGRFLTAEVLAGRSLATVQRRMGSLSALARRAGGRSLYDDPGLSEVVAGLRKKSAKTGGNVQRQATALTLDRLAPIIESIDTDGLKGLRDRAMLLVGWGALLRRSEIGELRRSDLGPGQRAGWLDLTVRYSKTSDEATVIALGRLETYPALCPVEAVGAWLDAVGDQLGPDDPLFPRVTRGGRILTDDDGRPVAIDGDGINEVIKGRTKAHTTGVERYSGHSLRRGGATDRARRGATILQLERAGRWAPGSTEVRKYIEAADRAEDQGATVLDVDLPEIELI